MRRALPLLALAALILAAAAHTEARPPDPEVRILGQSAWLAGGPAALRVVAYQPDGTPVEGVPVLIEIRRTDVEGAGSIRLAKGETDARGTCDVSFPVPASMEGSFELAVTAGEKKQTAPVTVRKEARLYLSTDKPLYQPGQTVHVRSLALGHPSLAAASGATLTLEIQDPKGNRVFRRSGPTSAFGVSAAEFDLAEEVNMGEYRVRASLGGNYGTAEAERTFTVKRYVLPKFKVSVKTDRDWYLPGDTVSGTVQADYFFGKPVQGGQVTLAVSAFDVATREVARLEGITDGNGTYRFELKAPDYLTGRPLDGGKGELQLEARVEDTAKHDERVAANVPVAASPIAVEVIPESDTLAQNLPNRLYVLTSYPDGSPAPARLELTLGDQKKNAESDATGFAEVAFEAPPVASADGAAADGRPWLLRFLAPAVEARRARPSQPADQPVDLEVKATDAQGLSATHRQTLTRSAAAESVRLRPEKALYRVGDTLRADILATKHQGYVYVDFLRDNQTVLTQSVPVEAGHGLLRMDLPADLYGQVTMHAYMITPGTDTVRDTRKLFVQPAKDLTVEVSADASTWKPGEEATLRFFVKGQDGRPRAAVLGVDVVDESLFALAEKAPGLERVYFLLERELLEPRYEVHGFTLEQAAEPKALEGSQSLARALMAELPEPPSMYTLDVDTFREKLAVLPQRMYLVQNAAAAYYRKHSSWPRDVRQLVREGLLKEADSVDPWGRPLALQKQPDGSVLPVSLGADGEGATADDVTMQTLYAQVDGLRMRREMPMPAGVARGGWGGEGGGLAMDAAAEVGADDRDEERKDKGRTASTTTEAQKPGSAPVRVRQWFPETLFTRPDLVTDETGTATLKVPMADSITTWRLTAFASSRSGEMGNATSPLRVFQDFFVDLDLPVAMTQNDRVSVPVAVYNYLAEPQTVTLTLEKGDWFTLDGEAEKSLKLMPNEVTSVYFPVTVKGIGDHTFTVTARGSQLSDAIRKPVRVTPDGREFLKTTSDRLQGQARTAIFVPEEAVPGSQRLSVTLYPGAFSQVVEGLDSILRMPGGCFEQTSSTTYPNVLVLDYLARSRKASPEVRMKAEGYINQGYQRLLTFEVPGGGFSVFGQAPANPMLTAYGLMEFADMAKVHAVDPNLISRTRQWLLAQQQKDGSWSAGREGFYAEGWQNVPNSAVTSTAYVAWGLVEAGARGPEIDRAMKYLASHLKEAVDPYQLALVSNALAAHDPKSPVARQALAALVAARQEGKGLAWWSTGIATASYGTGQPADIETTALAALALLRAGGEHTAVANRALAWLVKSKDAFGTWASTQATVLSLKALLGARDFAGKGTGGTVDLFLNGKKAHTFTITEEDFDLVRRFDATPFLKGGENVVELAFNGKGSAMYQVTGTYFMPWKLAPFGEKPGDPLDLAVSYDRTSLAVDDTATATVKATNRTKARANMVMLDVGVPPGFEVQTEDLTALVKKGTISKFSVAARQVILYLEGIDAGQTFTASYRVKARYPLRAQAPQSRVYEYYNPERQALVEPVVLEAVEAR